MSKLIPKDDYFKDTTRVMLSEDEKQRTIDAINHACQYLGRMSSIHRLEFTCRSEVTSLADLPRALRSLRDSSKYLGRHVILIKGSTQPRHLYRRPRRSAIYWESRKIANETGADFDGVYRLFLSSMDKYVGEMP